MARVEINKGAIKALFNQIGDKLKTTTERVVKQTADQPVEQAAKKLQSELAAIGAQFSVEQCRNCVETMRRGETFTFHLQ